MNYYKHHIGDYRRDTMHLTLLEHGAYRQLLDSYYLHESPIPLQTEQVCRRLSARTEEERRAIQTVLEEFFERTDGGWVHGRCDDELAEYRDRVDTARENGKRGGRPKKTDSVPAKNQAGTDRVLSGNPDETQTKPNQEPSTKKPRTTPTLGGFDEFWSAYPRKDAKDPARKAWVKINPDAELRAKIVAVVASKSQTRDWLKDNGQFVPMAATFLNQRRWEDESASEDFWSQVGKEPWA